MNAPVQLSQVIRLPAADGHIQDYRLSAPRNFPARHTGGFTRVAYSAVHVVADPLKAKDPWLDCAIDWDATLNYRRHLWRLGLGVAEAMDTAQRGMGLDWPTSLALIARSIDASKDFEARPVGQRGRNRSSCARAGKLNRRCDSSLRRAGCCGRKVGRQNYSDGFASFGASGPLRRRLSQGLRSGAVAGAATGHHSLAGRDVRSCAGGLLGLCRSYEGNGCRGCSDQSACCKN